VCVAVSAHVEGLSNRLAVDSQQQAGWTIPPHGH